MSQCAKGSIGCKTNLACLQDKQESRGHSFRSDKNVDFALSRRVAGSIAVSKIMKSLNIYSRSMELLEHSRIYGSCDVNCWFDVTYMNGFKTAIKIIYLDGKVPNWNV